MASIGRNLLLISCFMVLFVGPCCSKTDTLVQGKQLKDGHHLTSASGNFRLGFFSGAERNRHVGIWYNRPDEKPVRPVWVANRDTPIFDSSGVLMIGNDGHLKILHNGGQPIVLASVPAVGNIKAVLLNSGNFVIREVNSSGSIQQVLWQSFDYPTDTLLPEMRLGINTKTGHNWSLTSWLSKEDPALGSFTLSMDPNNTNQLIIWWQGEIYWVSGLWLNRSFNLQHQLSNDVDYHFSYHSEENEKFFQYFVYEDVIPDQRLTLSASGALWGMSNNVLGQVMRREDGTYEFISCEYPLFYDGCFGQKNHMCSPSDFKAIAKARMNNDGYKFKESENLTLNECKAKCLNNCFCIAYASTNHHNNTGCQIWSGCEPELPVDYRRGYSSDRQRRSCRDYRETYYYYNYYSYENKSDSSKYIYLRGYDSRDLYATHSSTLPIWITISTIGGLIILALVYNFISKKGGAKETVNTAKLQIWLIIRRTGGLFVLIFRTIYYLIREKLRVGGKINKEQQILIHELERRDGKKSHELQFFSFESIASATNNFEATNKLGEGGFGPVYKGQLPDGQEVAIKRLSKNSGQGLVEFKNEAILIAKLQHTNLVRLVGCCIHKEEKMLIYEYMLNKSLDFFIFDPVKKNILDWKKRFNVIQGIVQGLLYLHNYSRLRIIHRDLKASNILLDNEMNPKISDFGMARIFGSNDSEANTNRVVGTYGYMSPEYVMEGIFSTKSDVFSFGVLLLEILSGQKSYSSYHSERPLNLIGYAWELWGEGRGLELIDPILGDSDKIDQVLRCMHVGLLCVQESPIDRPAMLDVIFMIYNEANKLPAPKPPAFFIRHNIPEAEIVECRPENRSANKMSISEMQAR